MRKILNNYNKSKRLSGSSKGRIGTLLKIQDRNGEQLSVGDFIQWGEYRGVILYNPNFEAYGLAVETSMWYGTDKYDIESYGKFLSIPMDNGARIEIEKLHVDNAEAISFFK